MAGMNSQGTNYTSDIIWKKYISDGFSNSITFSHSTSYLEIKASKVACFPTSFGNTAKILQLSFLSFSPSKVHKLYKLNNIRDLWHIICFWVLLFPVWKLSGKQPLKIKYFGLKLKKIRGKSQKTGWEGKHLTLN